VVEVEEDGQAARGLARKDDQLRLAHAEVEQQVEARVEGLLAAKI